MSRTAWTLSGLLAVALVGSYFTWQNPPESAAIEETEVVSVDPSALTRLVYTHWEKRMVPAPAGKKPTIKRAKITVTLLAAKDADGRYWKVTDDDDGKVSTFTGGRMLTGVIQGLAPLKAYRVLDHDVAKHKKELGLAPPKGELTLYRGSRAWHFEVGGSSYGSVRRYLAPKGGHPVYLVQGMPFRLLGSSSRELMNKDLIGMPQQQMEKVTVKAGGKEVVLVHGNRAHVFKSFWAHPDKPTKKVPALGNWMEKVFRLRATQYLPKKAAPAPLETVATLVFHGDGSGGDPSTVTLKLLRGPEVKGQPIWYARSDHTRSLVKVEGGGAVANNLDSVLDGKG